MYNICEIILKSPTFQDILRTIRGNNVCTNVQCFETNEDAFRMMQPPSEDVDLFFPFLLIMMMCYCVFNLPPSLHMPKPRDIFHRAVD